MEVGEVIRGLEYISGAMMAAARRNQVSYELDLVASLNEAIRLLDTLRPRLQSDEPAPGGRRVAVWKPELHGGFGSWVCSDGYSVEWHEYWVLLPLPPAPAGKEVTND